MNEILLNFLENTFNYKKLRKARENRGYTLKYVEEHTGIPAPTIQRYEEGTIKNVSLDIVKKICNFYGTDYKCYYGWSTLPFLGSMSGILYNIVSNVSLEGIYNGAILGMIGGFISVIGTSKLYQKLYDEKKSVFLNKENKKDIIYNSLTQEEREKYKEFKTIAETLLKTNEMEDIKEETDDLLFTVYLLHNVRKKMGTNVFKYSEPR